MQLNATDAVTAIADLIEAGYIHDFRIRDGQIVDVGDGTVIDPAGLTVEARLRYATDDTHDDASNVYVLLADGGVDVIDVDSFDFALFNEAEEKGDAVLTCGAWSGVHPAFVGVPFLCGREVPVFLHYPLEPTLQVQKFVNAMAQLLN